MMEARAKGKNKKKNTTQEKKGRVFFFSLSVMYIFKKAIE
jgi:hypothetical protein